MNKENEAIMKSFNHNESKYKDVFAIINDGWTFQLHCPMKITLLREETNKHFTNYIYSKKRNVLNHKKVHNFFYMKYNLTPKQRHKLRDDIDPITLNDIDEFNVKLAKQMGDNNDDA
ncbi:hypothetical protein CR513_43586, partial [Mucuna pruriens]